jgi:hypothetical protein
MGWLLHGVPPGRAPGRAWCVSGWLGRRGLLLNAMLVQWRA